jgi:hypothetical protein
MAPIAEGGPKQRRKLRVRRSARSSTPQEISPERLKLAKAWSDRALRLRADQHVGTGKVSA